MVKTFYNGYIYYYLIMKQIYFNNEKKVHTKNRSIGCQE